MQLHEQAAQFYAAAYPGSKAEEHMTQRFGPDAAARSGLTVGYAPAGWRTLTDTLRGNGASEQELLDAGLARRNSIGKLQDTFRDRVVFAVRDEDNAIVGFTGRDLSGDERAPKYWNTNSTAAFDKGRLLLGAAEAGPDARLVRVEGAMDIVAINLASPDRTKVAGTAPMGTALTEHQADMLASRAVDGQVLEMLDADPAGMKARAKDAALLAQHGVSVRELGAGGFSDPAETYAFMPDLLRHGLEDAAGDEAQFVPAMHFAMQERMFGTGSETLRGADNSWPAAQALAPMVAAVPAQDQSAAFERAEELLIANGEGQLSPQDARVWLSAALRDEVGRRDWAAGTSWETLAADLAGDLGAQEWETDQEAQRVRDRMQADGEDLARTEEQLSAAATAPTADLTQPGEAAASREEVAGREHLADADQHLADEQDHRMSAAAVAAAPAPALYDRASISTPDDSQVTPAMLQARRRASAGFSQSTPEGVATAQRKRARLPRRPVKAARLGQRPGRENDRGM